MVSERMKTTWADSCHSAGGGACGVGWMDGKERKERIGLFSPTHYFFPPLSNNLTNQNHNPNGFRCRLSRGRCPRRYRVRVGRWMVDGWGAGRARVGEEERERERAKTLRD